MTASNSPTLTEAITRFLTTQSDAKSSVLQPALQKFIRWTGRTRSVDKLTPRIIEAYCEASGADSAAELAPVRGFLRYAHGEGLTGSNLGTHVKAKKRAGRAGSKRATADVHNETLTPESYQKVQAELQKLIGQRVEVAEAMRVAAADKDFKENAPLDAAREKQGHLEARIRELEQTLRYAEVLDAGTKSVRVRARLGSSVVVTDLKVNEELTYHLVSPSEVNLREGKISTESPTGKAFLKKGSGDTVKVHAPGGTLEYRIERVET